MLRASQEQHWLKRFKKRSIIRLFECISTKYSGGKNMCPFEKLKPYAGLFLRLGLGVIFVYHGAHKVFGEGANLGSSWNPHGMPSIMQIMVAWGELLAGLGCLTGVLSAFASMGIIAIMIGAIVMVHGKNGFSMMDHGFEYNYALIMMCLALMATGPGPFVIKFKNKSK